MISPLLVENSETVANIHLEGLPDDFLPSLGLNFLKIFYEGILEQSNIFGFVSQENNEVTGFVIGTENMTKFFNQAIMSRFFTLSYIVLKQILKKPQIIGKVLESLFFPNKETGPDAELVVIAVDNKFRGKNIGRELINALESELINREIKEYKVSVTSQNKRANRFYEKLGFNFFNTFILYDKSFNLLKKDLTGQST